MVTGFNAECGDLRCVGTVLNQQASALFFKQVGCLHNYCAFYKEAYRGYPKNKVHNLKASASCGQSRCSHIMKYGTYEQIDDAYCLYDGEYKYPPTPTTFKEKRYCTTPFCSYAIKTFMDSTGNIHYSETSAYCGTHRCLDIMKRSLYDEKMDKYCNWNWISYTNQSKECCCRTDNCNRVPL
uniref:Phospholipase A(2) n=1 Tax=Parastrongyloides trichosuri TaxID=131310 RepID=A0A0N4Z870_PARTI